MSADKNAELTETYTNVLRIWHPPKVAPSNTHESVAVSSTEMRFFQEHGFSYSRFIGRQRQPLRTVPLGNDAAYFNDRVLPPFDHSDGLVSGILNHRKTGRRGVCRDAEIGLRLRAIYDRVQDCPVGRQEGESDDIGGGVRGSSVWESAIYGRTWSPRGVVCRIGGAI